MQKFQGKLRATINVISLSQEVAHIFPSCSNIEQLVFFLEGPFNDEFDINSDKVEEKTGKKTRIFG